MRKDIELSIVMCEVPFEMATYVFSGTETYGISPKLRGLLNFDSLFGVQTTIYVLNQECVRTGAVEGGCGVMADRPELKVKANIWNASLA